MGLGSRPAPLNTSSIAGAESAGIAQNQPVSPIWPPITFTHMAAPNEISSDQGVEETEDWLILRPESEDSLIISARQKTTIEKGPVCP